MYDARVHYGEGEKGGQAQEVQQVKDACLFFRCYNDGVLLLCSDSVLLFSSSGPLAVIAMSRVFAVTLVGWREEMCVQTHQSECPALPTDRRSECFSVPGSTFDPHVSPFKRLSLKC